MIELLLMLDTLVGPSLPAYCTLRIDSLVLVFPLILTLDVLKVREAAVRCIGTVANWCSDVQLVALELLVDMLNDDNEDVSGCSSRTAPFTCCSPPATAPLLVATAAAAATAPLLLLLLLCSCSCYCFLCSLLLLLYSLLLLPLLLIHLLLISLIKLLQFLCMLLLLSPAAANTRYVSHD